MVVADVMTGTIVTVELDDTLGFAKELFDVHRFHHLLVVDKGKLAGIVSDRDLLRAVSPFVGKLVEREQDAATLRKRIHQIMGRQLVTVAPDEGIEACARLMLERRVSCLPVVDREGRPVGVATWRDLLRVLTVGTGTA